MRKEDFLSRLQGVTGGTDGQYSARCPNHDDQHASLRVKFRADGAILVCCQAGCEAEDVIWAMNLTMKDLAPERQDKPQKREVAVYQYTDAKGELLYEKVRYEPKGFMQRRPDGLGGRVYNLQGITPVLYNLRAVIAADTVYVVEGEKDADALNKLGLCATTQTGGAGKNKWLPQYKETLTGKNVVILADNDAPGKEYAHDVAHALYGKAASVKLVDDLAKLWPELPEHGDISDVIAYYGREGIDTLEALATLIGFTPEYRPLEAVRPEELKEPQPNTVCFSGVEYQEPEWIIRPYFPQGKITISQGDSGVGKTAFACALAALVSTGSPLIEHDVQRPGNVLIISTEDDPSTLRGRIEASGGDLSRCFFIPEPANLTFNDPSIEASIKSLEARLVVFDPLQAFLGGKMDMFRANETRPVLAKLAEMAARTECAVVIISHMSKGSAGQNSLYRVLGSVDIAAAARSVLYIGRNPQDEDECVIVQIKCSNAKPGPSIAYSIGERGGVTWKGYSPLTVEDIEAAKKREERGVDYDHEPLVQVFRQMITDKPGGGFWSYAEVKEIGMKSLGFPPFSKPEDLKQKLNSSFAKELMERDSLIITCGQKSRGERGIRIEVYAVPSEFQTAVGAGTL